MTTPAHRPDEDMDMSEALTIRDRQTVMAQSHPTTTTIARDTPTSELLKPTRRRTAQPLAPRNPRRITRSSSSRAPPETPIRRTPAAIEDSDDELSEVSMHSEPIAPIQYYEEATPRPPVARQLLGQMEGLALQTASALQTEATRREQQQGRIVQEGQQLVGALQEKFQQVDQTQGGLVSALGTLDQQLHHYAQTLQAQMEQRFSILARQAMEQWQHTQELASYIQSQEKDAQIVIPSAIRETMKQAKAAPQAPSLVLDLSWAKRTSKDKGKQPRVESEDEAMEGSGGQGRAPPPSPPRRNDRTGNRTPTPPPPRRSPSKSVWREEARQTRGGAGGGGGGNTGGGRPGWPGDDSSESSSSEEDRRRRGRKERRRRHRERSASPDARRSRKGDAPKQAKIPFSGKPQEDVRQWIDQMETLIDLQPRVNWDDRTRIQWASLELKDSAAKFWRNFKERLSVTPELGTWSQFKQELRIQYGNRTSQEQAKQKMDKLRQTGPIDDYINEMQNLEWDARVGPIVMKSMILTGINSSLEQRLSAAIEEPEDFPAWLSWVRKVGRKDAEVKARHEILRGQNTPAHQQNPPRDRANSHKRKRSRSPPESTPSRKKERENSPPPRRSTGSLDATREEKERWEKQGKCLRCGREGHFAKDCYSTSKVRKIRKRGRSSSRSRKTGNDRGDGENAGKKQKTQAEEFRSRITVLQDD